jgi:hypothetical protein
VLAPQKHRLRAQARHKEDEISLAYSISLCRSLAVWLPFDGEYWNPSHKPNAGSRGAFLVPRGKALADPVNCQFFRSRGVKLARERFQRRKLGMLAPL